MVLSLTLRHLIDNDLRINKIIANGFAKDKNSMAHSKAGKIYKFFDGWLIGRNNINKFALLSKYLKAHPEIRDKHQERARKLKYRLKAAGLPVMECSTSHIVPVLVGDAKRCKAMSDALLNDYSIYVQAINFPTVDVGTERLRFAPTPFHDDGMIEDLVEALQVVFNKF